MPRGAAVLAETCALLHDHAASSLYRLLIPDAKQNVADGTEISTGAVSRMLLRGPSTTPESERAGELLSAALSTYQELRMESYASRASATMRELNGR